VAIGQREGGRGRDEEGADRQKDEARNLCTPKLKVRLRLILHV
jgi:hypothetical protein